ISAPARPGSSRAKRLERGRDGAPAGACAVAPLHLDRGICAQARRREWPVSQGVVSPERKGIMAHRIVLNGCYVDTTTSVAGTKRTFSLGQCSTDGKDKPLKNIDVDLALSVAEAGNGSIDWTDVVVDANDTESPTKFYGGGAPHTPGGAGLFSPQIRLGDDQT